MRITGNKREPAVMQKIVLILAVCCCLRTSLAQPAMSRGQQQLAVNYSECLNRARQALRNVGFTAEGSGNFAQGWKDVSGAYIICNEIPGSGTVVNIVVATIGNDAGVPGYLRQLLQAQMERPGGALPPAAGQCPVGDWNWRWQGGATSVTVRSDGTSHTPVSGGHEGRWTYDTRSRTFQIKWDASLGTTDTITLTPDCRSGNGSNQNGVALNINK
jgi:hypothetical protein